MTTISVSKEKHALDACSVAIGNSINETNDIEKYCSRMEEEYCNFEDLEVISTFSCTDEGLSCDEDSCERILKVTAKSVIRDIEKTRINEVRISEESHEVNKVNAAVIILLDFSGSMRGNREQQLKRTITEFVNKKYDLNYAVLTYNSDLIDYTNISKGLNHDQRVISIVNNRQPSGGTNFIIPLEKARSLINSTDYESYYIVLITDGNPNEGSGPAQDFVDRNVYSIPQQYCSNSTTQNPCITVYTLGVDNANSSLLTSISGNSIDQQSMGHTVSIVANQSQEAFEAIISEIVCKIGPINSDFFNVFNGTNILVENEDFIYDDVSNYIKVYDESPLFLCKRMLEDNVNITLRKKHVDYTVRQ